jgi:hypothetical protein
MTVRLSAGLSAIAIVVPSILSIGALTFSLVPGLRVGVQPMVLFMFAANGLASFFFFVFFFGAPAATVIGWLSYMALTRRLSREPPMSRWGAAAIGAALGATIFPLLWTLPTPGAPLILSYVGPILLGASAGAGGGLAFFVFGVRRSATQPSSTIGTPLPLADDRH